MGAGARLPVGRADVCQRCPRRTHGRAAVGAAERLPLEREDVRRGGSRRTPGGRPYLHIKNYFHQSQIFELLSGITRVVSGTPSGIIMWSEEQVGQCKRLVPPYTIRSVPVSLSRGFRNNR